MMPSFICVQLLLHIVCNYIILQLSYIAVAISPPPFQDGSTALHRQAEKGFSIIAEHLLENGINPSIADTVRHTLIKVHCSPCILAHVHS